MVRVWVASLGRRFLVFLHHTGGMYDLFVRTLYWTFIAPFREKTEFRRHCFPLMEAIGNKSFSIVSLIAFLIGVILVLQTGYVLAKYGQIRQVAGLVAVSMTRELGPLMTAIVLVARVGAAFTAGLGTMTISEEVLALRIMGINPVGYLVAPRFIAMLIITPCLTVFANVVGIGGGCLMAFTAYDLEPAGYISDSITFLLMQDLVAGIVKSFLFAIVICIVSCYMALTVVGGPEGVARNTMVSVVTSLVLVIFVDSIATAFIQNIL